MRAARAPPRSEPPKPLATGAARWYPTNTEPSYDDMAVKLRRVIIAARFHSPCPEQATPLETQAVLAAWAAVSQAAGVVLVETVRAVGSVEATRARRHPASRA